MTRPNDVDTGTVSVDSETGTTKLSDWYDLVLGDHARIDIESKHRAGYYAKRIWAERDRHSGHAMRLVFTTGAGLGLSALPAITTVCSNTSNIFGAGWNYWDSAYGLIAASVDFPALKREQQQPKSSAKQAREFFAKLDCVASVNLTATTIVSQLALKGVVSAMWAPAGAVGFAACMWASFAHACYDLQRARKKTDPVYLLFDRVKKHEAVTDKLSTFTTTEQRSSAEYKQLLERQTRLKLQIDALYHTHIDKINGAISGSNTINSSNHLNSSEKNYLYTELRRLGKQQTGDRLSKFIRAKSVTPAQQATYRTISKRLLKKQQTKVKKRAWYASTWGLAAIGMTLVALACVCPPLAAIGAVITAVAGVSKLMEIAEDYNWHKKLFTNNSKKFKAELAKDHHTDTGECINQIHALFKEKNPDITKAAIRKLYRVELRKKPEERKRLYKRAHQRFTENRLIHAQLSRDLTEDYKQHNNGNVPATADLVTMEKEAFSALSEKDRDKLVEKALHHNPTKTKQHHVDIPESPTARAVHSM
ncbi:MAG: hypothetical protein P1U63_01860 [Coxiellaceae bacterium]|nr:hypothetical protein [Coxiellaceae bacterium]